MIEAPEALYLCEQLNKTVKGKRITNVFTLFTPHKFAWFSGSPDEYAEWLTGKSIDHARSQGGMVEMTIGDKMLNTYGRSKSPVLRTGNETACQTSTPDRL